MFQLINPEDAGKVTRYAAQGQLDGVSDAREVVASRATYVDPMETRLARPRR